MKKITDYLGGEMTQMEKCMQNALEVLTKQINEMNEKNREMIISLSCLIECVKNDTISDEVLMNGLEKLLNVMKGE